MNIDVVKDLGHQLFGPSEVPIKSNGVGLGGVERLMVERLEVDERDN